ncbi:hypothetical protein HDU97_009658 [Phlyctochytrium planicorne]|nr:hypothetical protein HDU97_009658 [Phlyctochytrium planicorne]
MLDAMKKEMEAKVPKIEKGYCIKCINRPPKQPKQDVYINVASTKSIAPPPKDDPLNIPMCISQLRTGVSGKGDPYCIIDAVVNDSIIEKCANDGAFKRELLDLSAKSAKDTELPHLDLKTQTVIDNHYEGPIWVPPPADGPPELQPEIKFTNSNPFKEEDEKETKLQLPSGAVIGKTEDLPQPTKKLIQDLGPLPDYLETETSSGVSYDVPLPLVV